MAFATLSDMQARFGDRELQLVASRDGGLIADVVAAALADAESEVIGLVGRAVPIEADNPPLIVRRITCDFARYRLHTQNMPELVRKNYEDGVAFLKRVADGKAVLDGGAEAPTEVARPSLAAAVVAPDRLFKRGLG